MSKLDDIIHQVSEEARQAIRDYRDHKEPKSRKLTELQAKQDVKNLLLDLIVPIKSRETTDMTLQSWTPDDYKEFGRNELKIELINKIKEL